MSLQRPRREQPRTLALNLCGTSLRAPRLWMHALWPAAMALGLAACANPRELTSGALPVSGKRIASWEAEVSPRSDAARRLSEGEGETVVANAVAAHEKRRP